MDVLIELLIFFIRRWRLGLMTLGAIVAAVVLSNIIDWFTSPFCIGLALTGFVAGVLWQGAAEEAQFLNPRVAGHRPRRAKQQGRQGPDDR